MSKILIVDDEENKTRGAWEKELDTAQSSVYIRLVDAIETQYQQLDNDASLLISL